MFNAGVLGLFFPLWLAEKGGGGDSDLGFTIAICLSIVIVLSPIVGVISDQIKSRLPILFTLSIITGFSTLALGFTNELSNGRVIFSIGFMSVYIAELIYNSLLTDITDKKNRGRVAGAAIGIGYTGVLIVVGMGLYLEENNSNYSAGFIAISICYFASSLPVSFLLIEKPKITSNITIMTKAILQAWSSIITLTKTVMRDSDITKLLIGRYFYMASILTASSFAVFFGIETIGFTTEQVQYVLLLAVLFAIPGTLFWGNLVDKIGSKKTLQIVLIGWSLVLSGTIAIPVFNLDTRLWWILAILMGTLYGGVWAADRPLLINLSQARIGGLFGLYAITSRSAYLTGAFAWPFIANVLGYGQVTALIFLVFCGILGLIFILRIKQNV
jgi:UMF1 family MFS transporter